MCVIIVTAKEHRSQEFTETIIIQPFQSQNQPRPDLLTGLVLPDATYFHDPLRIGGSVAAPMSALAI